MSEFTIKFNESQLQDVRRALYATKAMPERVMSRAINTTLAGVRTDISSESRKLLAIKKRDLDKYIKVTQKARPEILSGKVTTEGSILPLISFPHRVMPMGVEVKPYLTQPAKMHEGAFKATMKSGHVAIFKREYIGPGTKRGAFIRRPWQKMPRKFRLPIEERFGPRLSTIVASNPVMKPVLENSGARLKVAMVREINYELSKVK